MGSPEEAQAQVQDWENSKENFQPLKAGRKPGALRDCTADLRRKQIEEQRRVFWEELAGYKGEDPLEVWLRFIKWTQEAFSAGGHKAELLPLLERCTRELQGMEQYRGDVRYLRLWVQYADCLPDPGDVFSFLKENDIGQEHALYYIAYATYLEFRGNYARVDSVYQQGINRLAAPVERLRTKFQEFQHRMARRIQRKAAEQAGAAAAEPEHPERRTLGVLGGRRPVPRPPTVGGLGGIAAGAAGVKRKAGTAAENAPSGGGSGLDIFVDDEFSGEGAQPPQSAPAALFMPGRSAAAPWSALGGYEQGRKENSQRAGTWAGQRLKQKLVHSAPAAPALEVFEDPELAEAGGGGGSQHEGGATLRQRLERPGGGACGVEGASEQELEGLMKDPLRLHKAQAVGGPQPPAGAAASEARRREEMLAFDQDSLRRPDGEELSFEEVRAERWLARRAEREAAAVAAAEVQGDESEEMDLQEDSAPAAEEAAATPAGSPAADAAAAGPVEVEPQLDAGPAGLGSPIAAAASPQQLAAGVQGLAAADAAENAAAEEEVHQQGQPAAADEALPTPFDQPAAWAEPTMTLNSKDAWAAINGMFGGALPEDGSGSGAVITCGSRDVLPQPLPAAAKPTMTINTRDAFAAMNRMFKGALPTEHGGMLPPSQYAEPTMTLNTRDAFAAINNMFKGSLPTEHGMLPPTAAGPAGADPTVTISTRAAFEAMNQMFGSGSSAPAAAAFGQPQAAGNGGFRMPAPRPPRRAATQPMPASPGGDEMLIREDTQFITVAGSAAESDEEESEGQLAGSPSSRPPLGGSSGLGGFSIREDTLFISGVAAPPASPADSPALGDSFCIREDTQFVSLAQPVAAEELANGGLCIREDTLFLGPAGGGSSPACSSPPASGLGGGRGAPRAPLGEHHEETGELLLGDLSPMSADPGSASHAQVSKWGFAPGADDTMAFELGAGDTQQLLAGLGAQTQPADAPAGPGAATTAAPAASTGLTQSLQRMQLGEEAWECKENIIQQQGRCGGATSGRNIQHPAVAESALHAMSTEQAAGLGVGLHADADADAALVAARATAAADATSPPRSQDSFGVLSDGSSGSPGSSNGGGSPWAMEGLGQQLASPAAGGQQEQQAWEGEQQRQGTKRGWMEEGGARLLDPFHPRFHAEQLAGLQPPVTEWPGVSCMSQAEEAETEAALRRAARPSGPLQELQLCGLEFAVSGVVGEGAYARVFGGVDGDCADVALKWEAPPCPWEWYIGRALQGRLPSQGRACVLAPSALLLGEGASLLVAPLGQQGSLQQLINAQLAAAKQTLPELAAMHLCAALCRALGHLHTARVLHADIKPDNLLLTLGEAQQQQAAAGGDENAAPALPVLGLQLIDFGRSVDLELLPPGALLQGDSGTDSFRCVDMREGTPWLWQADAYAAAGVAHCLLYGRYMEVERVRCNTTGVTSLRLRHPLKRQWAQDVWGELFTTLLNATATPAPPPWGALAARLESYLGSSPDVQRRAARELQGVVSLLPQQQQP